MEIKIQLALTAMIIPVIFSELFYNYCEIPSCPYRSHTLCIYSIAREVPRCGQVLKARLTETEKLRIVNLHNNIRRKVFSGHESRGKNGLQPPAKNITFLQWNNELARVAKRWAEQCIHGVDKCRNIEDFDVYQSVDGDKDRESPDNLTIDKIITKWHDEVEDFDSSQIPKFSEFNALMAGTYHYTQIIWQNTEYIGCASTKYFDRRYYRLLLVCNYAPKGNNDGEEVYQIQKKKQLNHKITKTNTANKY